MRLPRGICHHAVSGKDPKAVAISSGNSCGSGDVRMTSSLRRGRCSHNGELASHRERGGSRGGLSRCLSGATLQTRSRPGRAGELADGTIMLCWEPVQTCCVIAGWWPNGWSRLSESRFLKSAICGRTLSRTRFKNGRRNPEKPETPCGCRVKENRERTRVWPADTI